MSSVIPWEKGLGSNEFLLITVSRRLIPNAWNSKIRVRHDGKERFYLKPINAMCASFDFALRHTNTEEESLTTSSNVAYLFVLQP